MRSSNFYQYKTDLSWTSKIRFCNSGNELKSSRFRSTARRQPKTLSLCLLGYDVFNPLEVIPEFVADIGIKKGEKVDYAIMKNDKLVILVECKHWSEKLDPHNSQHFHYFHTTNAKFGLLSNGVIYRFYTDLIEPNKMDEKPFFEFNVSDIKDNQIEELKKFHKSYFDIGNIQNTASELKYMSELKALIHNEFLAPSDGFVRHLARQLYQGMLTSKLMEQFTGLTKKSIQQYINDLTTERLQSALKSENNSNDIHEDTAAPLSIILTNDVKIETTPEELEGFLIVKAMLRQKVKPERIVYRDVQSYFAILLDDNNRKSICRLYLNGSKQYLGTFDGQKKETRHEIHTVDDLFCFADSLLQTVAFYDSAKSDSGRPSESESEQHAFQV